MKAMLLAFLSIFVIAVIADLALDRAGFSTEQQTTGSSVRIN